MDLEVLKIWPDWQAVRLIGEGSFGKVYEIVRNNFSIEEHCALKVISIPTSQAELESMRSEGMNDDEIKTYYHGMVEEFVQEIAMMSKLKGNVNIVSHEDYAVVEHKNSIGWDILIRMELLTALPNHLRKNPLSEKDVINLSIDLCNALITCANHKIIHRDIKLDNIFLSKDMKYKLGDFGVARTVEKTISGLSKKGTYTYMAPEVYKSQPYGLNVDLYSLGIVMYKLLNNNREPFLPPHPQPITHSSKNDALVRRMSGEIIPPPANASVFLRKIVLKACNFNPQIRYQTPQQMKADLESVKNSIASGTTPVLTIDHISNANTNTSAHSHRTNHTAARQKGNNSSGYKGTQQTAYNSNKTFIGSQPTANSPRPHNTYHNTMQQSVSFTQNGTPNSSSSVTGSNTGKYTNKDIYHMAMKRQPYNMETEQAKRMMVFVLKKVVPTYSEKKNLAKEIKKCGIVNVRNNVVATDTDSLFLILKTVHYHLSKGADPKDLSVIVYNTYETLKKRLQ